MLEQTWKSFIEWLLTKLNATKAYHLNYYTNCY